MINFLIGIYTKTIAKLNFPFSHKRFNPRDYFPIEVELGKLPVSFAVILVTTYGSGSNIGIKIAQWIGVKKWSKKTHAVAYIDCRDGYKHRIAEASGSEGIRIISLLEGICQKDEVSILVPDYHVMNESICNFTLKYLHGVLDRDKESDVDYDNDHDLMNTDLYDCSELLFHAINYGYKRARHVQLLEPVKRAKRLTFTPLDLELSPLFIKMYDSKEGGFLQKG